MDLWRKIRLAANGHPKVFCHSQRVWVARSEQHANGVKHSRQAARAFRNTSARYWDQSE